MSGNRPEIDQHACSYALHHPRNHRCRRHIQQSLHVGVNHLVPVGDLALVKLLKPAAQSRIVHQNLNRFPFLTQTDNRCFHRAMISHIQRKGMHILRAALSRFFCNPGQLLHTPRRQQQLCTLAGKRQRRRRTDPRARSRNKNNLPLKFHASILSNRKRVPHPRGVFVFAARVG